MKETTVRYWPNSKAIPEGWELASEMDETHHGQYSVLIREKSHDVIVALCGTQGRVIK
jgi:hypothetical protein